MSTSASKHRSLLASRSFLGRRSFLAASLSLGVSTWAGTGLSGTSKAPAAAFPTLGAQLYTVRDAFQADPLKTLETLRAIGYGEVETAGLAGRTPRAIRGFLDAAGVKAASSHVTHDDWFNRPEAALDEVAELGAGYAILPWLAEEKRGDWVALGSQMNHWADLAKPRGIQVGYHNHEFEFIRSGGDILLHRLMAATDPSKVVFELDVYWASLAGHDPLHILHEHGDRIRLLHLKDKAADGAMVSVGKGVIDFTQVLAAAKTAGVKHVFVEHDMPADPFATLREGYAHLTKV